MSKNDTCETDNESLSVMENVADAGSAEKPKRGRGIYDHHLKTRKADVLDFVKFTLRDDINDQLNAISERERTKLAVELYKKECNKDIKLATAKRHFAKYILVNGNVYKKNDN